MTSLPQRGVRHGQRAEALPLRARDHDLVRHLKLHQFPLGLINHIPWQKQVYSSKDFENYNVKMLGEAAGHESWYDG